MPAIDCPIREQEWLTETSESNGQALVAPASTEPADAGSWEPAVRVIVELQHLQNDWDGAGAAAPSRPLLQSAIGLAYLFLEKGLRPPDRVVPGVAGEVIFEWQDPDGTYAEVEIDRPHHAEVLVIEPGKPAKQWTLPTQ